MRRYLLVLAVLASVLLGADVLARRLLMSSSGSGGFTPPAPFVVSTLTSPGEGGGVWFGGPRAIRNGSETLIGYQTGDSGGDVKAIRVTNSSGAIAQTATLYNNFQVDDHDPPSFVVRPDGIILAAFAYHVGELYVGIGPSAGVLPAQANVTNITSQVGSLSGSAGYTYASIVYVPAETRYYIFFRYHDTGGIAHVGYTYSDDSGATWSARTLVCVVTYHHIILNGTGRLDLIVSNHPDDAGNHDVRHLYFSGGNWYKTDGTQITASQPFAITQASLVWDGSTTMGWLWDIAIDPATNYPVLAFATFPGATNPGGPATDHRYYDGRWNGSAWSTHQIALGGGKIPTADQPIGNPQSFYSGGIALDPSDPRRVLYSSDTSGQFQMYYAVTADGGTTYSITALTSDGDKNVRPHWVVGHTSGLQGFWWSGTYTNYATYSQGIKVVGQ